MGVYMALLFIIIGILGLIWCLIPRIVYGVLNIGNITGIIVFLAFLAIGIFYKRFKAFIKRTRDRKAGRIFLGAAELLVAVIAVFTIIETICMFGASRKGPDGTETVVVLGSYVNRAGPSIMTATRLNAAYDYLTAHPDAVCIVTGGQGDNEPWPEADAMCDYLVERGISADRIYKERESKNTRENLKFAENIIEEHSLNKKIVIVSNEFHLYRAGRIADRLDIDHTYISAHSPWGMFSSFYIRELYAILADWFVYS